MANETQEIVLKIEVEQSQESLAKVRASMDLLIQKRQALTEASKAGDDEAAKSLEGVNSSLRNLTTEYKAQQRVLDGYNGSVKAGANLMDFGSNSILKNRNLLKQLTAQYISMDAPSKASIDNIKKLSDKLKEQEAAIGNTSRNVGNYKEALSGAFKELNGIGKVIDPIKNMGLAFESAGGGVKGFSLALAATGLPLIISGVNALIDVFKEFGGVADTVEQITAGISGGFTAFVSGGSALAAGKQIASLTADLQQLNEEGERSVLVTAQTNSAIKRLQVAAKDRTKTEEERIGLLKQADDLAEKLWKDNDARLTKQALKEEAVFAAKHNLTEMEVRLAIFSNDVIKKQYDFLTDEQIDKKRDAVGKIVKLDGEEVKKLIEGRVKLTQSSDAYTDIVDKNAVKANKLADDAKEKADKRVAEDAARNEKLKQQKEQYLKNLASLETEFNLNEREKLAKRFEDKIASITGSSQRETQLRLIIAQEEVFALEKFDKDYADKKKKIQDDLVKHNAESLAKITAQNTTSNSQHLKDEKETADKEIEIAKQKEAFKKDLTNRLFAFTTGVINAIAQAEQDASNARLSELEANQESEKAKLQDQYNHKIISKKELETKTAAIDKEFKDKEREEKKKQWEINKGIQITNAIIQTAQAVLSAYSSGAAYPFVGPATGAIFAAIAGALGAVQIGVIAAQQPPKFAEGGKVIDIGGNYHSEGGTPIHVGGQYVAEAEKDEGLFIMKRTAYQAGKLSNWNQLFGGKSWGVSAGNHAAQGGMVIPTDGGFAARDIARSADNSAMIQQAIKNGFALAPAPVLSIVEFQDKQASRNRSVNISEM